MSNKQLIFSLDIGSSKIVALVGTIQDNMHVHGMSVYNFLHKPHSQDFLTIRQGVISNINTIANIIHNALNEARIIADCTYGDLVVNITGRHVYSKYAIEQLSFDNERITNDIIVQMINGIKNSPLTLNESLLDYEVQEYVVNQEQYTVNPLDLTASQIKLHANLFVAPTPQLYDIKSILNNSPFRIARVCPSAILSALAVLTHDERENGVCLIDIGFGTTDIICYENGFIRYLATIPYAGDDITHEVAAAFTLSKSAAEDIKVSHKIRLMDNQFHEKIHINDAMGHAQEISHAKLITLIQNKLRQLFEAVRLNLLQHDLYHLVQNIVITGGTASFAELDKFATKCFGKRVRIGTTNYSNEFADVLQNPKYATSIGGIIFAREYMLNDPTLHTSTVKNKLWYFIKKLLHARYKQ